VKKFIFVLLTMLFCLSAGEVLAQDDLVRVIPVQAMIPNAVLSPDRQTLVLYENGVAQTNHLTMIYEPYLPLRLIDLETGKERLLTGHTDYTSGVAFTPDGTRLVSYHNNGYMIVWDVINGQLLKQIPAIIGATRLVMLPDGHTVALVSNLLYGQVWLWDIETEYITGILIERAVSYDSFMEQYGVGKQARYFGIAVSPDGAQLATVDFASTITLWDLTSHEPRLLREGSEQEFLNLNLRHVEFSSDGERLVYFDMNDTQFHFLSTTDGSEIQTIAAADRAHTAVAFDYNLAAWVNPGDNTLVVVDIDHPNAQTVIELPPSDLAFGAPMLDDLFFTANNQLVFSGFTTEDGKNQIYVIDVPE
jgi:WD40 repeat protein